jgi:hypothetical protein
MPSVRPPENPADEPRTRDDLGSATAAREGTSAIHIHWTVDLGEELTIGDIADYTDAFRKVVDAGEWLGLMMVENANELYLAPTLVYQLSYGSPWSVILAAPKQLAEGIVCLLDFVVNVPANVKEHWSKAREASARAALLTYFESEIEAGRIKLTRDQVFQLFLSLNLPALHTLAASQVLTFGSVNHGTGTAHWRI